jgi:glucan phosphoethanolaminetransferase (alkaline phosphatase superfamily)
MVSLIVIFYIFTVLYSIIGGMRGWAKEMLVSFSLILALFLIFIFQEYAPIIVPFDQLPVDTNDASKFYIQQFWIRAVIVGLLVFFGYQTPNISKFAPSVRREKIQDFLLGLVLGAVNGFLIVGTLWSYMHSAGYPFAAISAPEVSTDAGNAALALISKFPPVWLGTSPWIYVAVGIAFLFVMVVFI